MIQNHSLSAAVTQVAETQKEIDDLPDNAARNWQSIFWGRDLQLSTGVSSSPLPSMSMSSSAFFTPQSLHYCKKPNPCVIWVVQQAVLAHPSLLTSGLYRYPRDHEEMQSAFFPLSIPFLSFFFFFSYYIIADFWLLYLSLVKYFVSLSGNDNTTDHIANICVTFFIQICCICPF